VDRKRYDDARAQLSELAALPDREIMDSVYRRRGAELAKAIEKKKGAAPVPRPLLNLRRSGRPSTIVTP
jgi:hypothetical protein